MFNRLILILSLVFLFGFGQQAAVVHAVSHLADVQESSPHKQLPHSQSCEKCVVYAQLGSTIDVEHVLLLLNGEHQKMFLERGVHRALQHNSQYAARAPPALS
jgi:hypothetical protein